MARPQQDWRLPDYLACQLIGYQAGANNDREEEPGDDEHA